MCALQRPGDLSRANRCAYPGATTALLRIELSYDLAMAPVVAHSSPVGVLEL